MQLHIDDTFNKELPADPSLENRLRQVHEACFSFVTPTVPAAPEMIHVSAEVADLLGLSKADTSSEEFLHLLTGAKIYEGTQPYAMCYGGHQFGHWAGQLGDGRAINLMEVVHREQRWTLQLKGAGKTPYSRNADGLAVLRSSIREHLCSEAMYHLGVPTTRSLSLALSGNTVLRDVMYDGRAAYEKGAIICRVAPTFIRFGNFEIFSSRRDTVTLKKLADYTIRHFFPEIKMEGKEKYLEFFQTVVDRTLEMIVHWQRVGFVHGVMNTDNLSILGITIDYGPYGWLEDYDQDWTPNTTDAQQRRYRYGQQPSVALWNLYQLANALLPLIETTEPLQAVLDSYEIKFEKAYTDMMLSKLGLTTYEDKDRFLLAALEETLALTETDMTIFFRLLSTIQKTDTPQAMLDTVKTAFYKPEELTADLSDQWLQWLADYGSRLQNESLSDAERMERMNRVNPKYVLRNYMAQLAIDAADKGDYSVVEELYQLLKLPYAEQPEMGKWFAKRPDWARDKVGCSMLSCSS
jgi:serine/tyrosine/threonine adenylyltransferase